MPQKNYTFPVDGDKLDAIELFLKQEDNSSFLNEELNASIDRIYRKCVPKNVRDYIALQSGREPEKVKKRAKKASNVQPKPTPSVTASAPQSVAFYQPDQFVSRE